MKDGNLAIRGLLLVFGENKKKKLSIPILGYVCKGW